jgi:hypothetical protein
VLTAESPGYIRNLFTNTVPQQAARFATRWRTIGAHLYEYYETLRSYQLGNHERTEALEALRTDAGHALEAAGITDARLGWALEARDEAQINFDDIPF